MQQIPWLSVLLIGAFGALGCVLRFFLVDLVKQVLCKKHYLIDKLVFPKHTLFANLLGCFFMGFLGVILEHPSPFTFHYAGAAFLIGFCGGLTTFSSVILDSLEHILSRQYKYAVSYLFLTIVGSLISCWLGVLTGYFYI